VAVGQAAAVAQEDLEQEQAYLFLPVLVIQLPLVLEVLVV